LQRDDAFLIIDLMALGDFFAVPDAFYVAAHKKPAIVHLVEPETAPLKFHRPARARSLGDGAACP
jgi:hypothetical protein